MLLTEFSRPSIGEVLSDLSDELLYSEVWDVAIAMVKKAQFSDLLALLNSFEVAADNFEEILSQLDEKKAEYQNQLSQFRDESRSAEETNSIRLNRLTQLVEKCIKRADEAFHARWLVLLRRDAVQQVIDRFLVAGLTQSWVELRPEQRKGVRKWESAIRHAIMYVALYDENGGAYKNFVEMDDDINDKYNCANGPSMRRHIRGWLAEIGVDYEGGNVKSFIDSCIVALGQEIGK